MTEATHIITTPLVWIDQTHLQEGYRHYDNSTRLVSLPGWMDQTHLQEAYIHNDNYTMLVSPLGWVDQTHLQRGWVDS